MHTLTRWKDQRLKQEEFRLHRQGSFLGIRIINPWPNRPHHSSPTGRVSTPRLHAASRHPQLQEERLQGWNFKDCGGTGVPQNSGAAAAGNDTTDPARHPPTNMGCLLARGIRSHNYSIRKCRELNLVCHQK